LQIVSGYPKIIPTSQTRPDPPKIGLLEAGRAAFLKVGTIENSPSDRILTRMPQSAELVRLPLSPNFPADAIELFRGGQL
jgi:hypothetical protein